MGLVALNGGGIPPFASTATSTGDGTSTNPPAALGSRAFDSSGGEYVLARGHSSVAAGSVVLLNSSAGKNAAQLVSTGSTVSTGGAVGVALAAHSDTNTYGWFQVAGAGSVLGNSTDGAAGSRLWLSTANEGAVNDASGGNALQGIQITSSNASSLWNVNLSYPALLHNN